MLTYCRPKNLWELTWSNQILNVYDENDNILPTIYIYLLNLFVTGMMWHKVNFLKAVFLLDWLSNQAQRNQSALLYTYS